MDRYNNTPYGLVDVKKLLSGQHQEWWHTKEIEMESGDGERLAKYLAKKGLEVIYDEENEMWSIPNEYSWTDGYFYPYEDSNQVIEESIIDDVDPPFTFTEVRDELKRETNNWETEEDTIRYFHAEEKDFAMEVLSHHYECEYKGTDEDGWYVIHFWKQDLKEGIFDKFKKKKQSQTRGIFDKRYGLYNRAGRMIYGPFDNEVLAEIELKDLTKHSDRYYNELSVKELTEDDYKKYITESKMSNYIKKHFSKESNKEKGFFIKDTEEEADEIVKYLNKYGYETIKEPAGKMWSVNYTKKVTNTKLGESVLMETGNDLTEEQKKYVEDIFTKDKKFYGFPRYDMEDDFVEDVTIDFEEEEAINMYLYYKQLWEQEDQNIEEHLAVDTYDQLDKEEVEPVVEVKPVNESVLMETNKIIINYTPNGYHNSWKLTDRYFVHDDGGKYHVCDGDNGNNYLFNSFDINEVNNFIKNELHLDMEIAPSPLVNKNTEEPQEVIDDQYLIDWVGACFETGHGWAEDFDEFVEMIQDEFGSEISSDKLKQLYSQYQEMCELGPAGFYEEYKDRFDFSSDYISEYGDEEYTNNEYYRVYVKFDDDILSAEDFEGDVPEEFSKCEFEDEQSAISAADKFKGYINQHLDDELFKGFENVHVVKVWMREDDEFETEVIYETNNDIDENLVFETELKESSLSTEPLSVRLKRRLGMMNTKVEDLQEESKQTINEYDDEYHYEYNNEYYDDNIDDLKEFMTFETELVEHKYVTLDQLAQKIKVNGPRSREDNKPEAIQGYINEINIPDNMRMKSFNATTYNDTVTFNWKTQEPFTDEDAKSFVVEVKEAFEYQTKICDYTKPYKIDLTVSCRSGDEDGYYKEIISMNDSYTEFDENIMEEDVELKWNMGSDKLQINETEHEYLETLAKKLEDNSPNGYRYRVKQTYEDFGANMQWFNIICYDKQGNDWQVLNTKVWLDLMNSGDIEAAYSEIVNGDYFKDTLQQGNVDEMNHRQLMSYMDTLDD